MTQTPETTSALPQDHVKAVPDFLVLEITSHAPDGTVTHRKLESFPATLGRGYHNDIILSDPHVSAAHVHIERTAEGFTVADLGSENGLLLNNAKIGIATPLKSGDRLRIGLTDIRIFSPAHQVPAASVLQRASAFLSVLSRSIVVWPLLIISLAALTGSTYLQLWNPDVGEALAKTVAGGLVIILLWSVIWATAGRLIRNKSRFRSHVSLVSLGIIISIISFNIQEYVDFLTNENGFSVFFSYFIDTLVLSWLLIHALALATDMPKRRRRLAGFFFSAGLMGGLFLLSYVSANSFNKTPSFASQLEPYLASAAVAETPKTFMQGSAKLFEADTFHSKPVDDDGDDEAPDESAPE